MDKLLIPVADLRPVKKYYVKLAGLIKPFKRVALTSTIQFKHLIPEVKGFLKDHEVIICPSVLGCSALIPDTDCTVLITTGVFHAIKAGLSNGKPVFIIGPDGVKQLDDKLIKDFRKKQSIRVSQVLDAKVVGVLLSTKPGQLHGRRANEIVLALRKAGKEAYLFVANELSPSQLNDFPVDAWINTACPRIAEDEFDKPVANWEEVKSNIG